MNSAVATILLLIIVVAILVIAYQYVWKPRRPRGERYGVGTNGKGDMHKPAGEPDLSLDRLKTGDVLALWNGEELLVETVVNAQESSSGRTNAWRWVFLEGGRVLTVAKGGNIIYDNTEIIYQGSAEFEQLTGDLEHGGVLKLFESRVRGGMSGSQPAYWEYGDETYRVASTGTFVATAGTGWPDREIWQDAQDDEQQNVYFRLEAEDGTQALGIWTSHIAFLTGRTITTSDIREVYRVGR